MPQLPSSVVSAIRQAIKEYPTDMLMRLPITYQLHSQAPSRWGESQVEEYIAYALLGLYVQAKGDKAEKENVGGYEDAEGYFLFNFDDLNVAGLIQNGLPIFNANLDQVIANSKTYEVLGVHPLGQLVDTYTMVKVIVKTKIK